MKQLRCVYHNEVLRFLKAKGMIVFYILNSILCGCIYPIISHDILSAISYVGVSTLFLARPILADSIALEREKKTLEPLLSSPLSCNSIFLGKFLFSVTFMVAYFILSSFLLLLSKVVLNIPFNLKPLHLHFLLFAVIITFIVVSMVGVYYSAKSKDAHTANQKLSLIIFLFSILLISHLSILFIFETYVCFIYSITYYTLLLILATIFIFRLYNMKRFDYFEGILKKSKSYHSHVFNQTLFHSQFFAVVRHEMKYLWTLKRLLLNFLLMMFSPAIIICLMRYYKQSFDLNYVILVTTLLIPRIPTNLIAYSVGGEKVYRTGESLLSTPLKSSSMFLGKCCIPIIVSAAMLLASSFLVQIAMPLYCDINNLTDIIPQYSLSQLLLLFPANLLACTLMIFISATNSLLFTTPRQGLYVTSFVSFVFVLPVALTQINTSISLQLSILYIVLLVIGILAFLGCFIKKVDRYVVMSKL